MAVCTGLGPVFSVRQTDVITRIPTDHMVVSAGVGPTTYRVSDDGSTIELRDNIGGP
jgi:hypothetical protein